MIQPITTSLARRFELDGHVQGVGFRPFVYRLAIRYGLSGQVCNEVGRVSVLVQGERNAIDAFCHALLDEAPPLARPRIVVNEAVVPVDLAGFSIKPSRFDAAADVYVPADQFTCADCLRELADGTNRRYRYPFINCTNCGPRYTLISAMPYDRRHTTMATFELCADCRGEYEDPDDRRFHAEPIACAACGPSVVWQRGDSAIHTATDAVLSAATQALRGGEIIAVKGIGGYHLMCDARSDAAIKRLRQRKQRPDKPLAVMFPVTGDDGLGWLRESVALSDAEADAVLGPSRPIVLARRRDDCPLSDQLAPGLGELGVFLPYSPLHELLLRDVGAPLVATSGNVSGEPVLTDPDEASTRLAGIADGFLHHDRPIARPADDPVLRSLGGRVRPIRLGRGAAPLELHLPAALTQPMLAVGGQMKGAIALAFDDRVVVSPHLGEMNTPRSLDVFERTVTDLQALYGVRARRVVCDAHPGYGTYRWAQRCGLAVHAVPHHHAHASALWGEHPSDAPTAVFTWDGVGMGSDGTLWGGETFVGAPGYWRRVASFRPFHLPGGERAGREPWRSAAALCWALGQHCPVGPANTALVREAWQRRVNTPATSAVGRLFDAAAAITLGIEKVSHEGAGPMRLEALAASAGHVGRRVTLPFERDEHDVVRIDWAPLLANLLDTKRDVVARAAAFHQALAGNLLDQARWLRDEHGIDRVGLTGGVFQNRLLVDSAAALLSDDGFSVRLARRVPCNDGGLCFGQVIEAAAETRL